ncbi:hypothetical protein [Rheinheimera sp.]|uniref:hypothetical protein n=1 Tax=Rheinheimera sp. TaxID=1869214 RepID=UPI002FDECC7A
MALFLYYLVNGLVVLFTLSPLGFLLLISRKKVWAPELKLFFGFIAVILAGLYFSWLSGSFEHFESAAVATVDEVNLKADILAAFGLWVFVIPALYLALGVNFISSFVRFGEHKT